MKFVKKTYHYLLQLAEAPMCLEVLDMMEEVVMQDMLVMGLAELIVTFLSQHW